MFAGAFAFTTPLLLWALVLLPVLWFLLRAVPPAPIRKRFPGVALLLGLQDQSAEADKTPWWLLALRMFALAAALIGFAGPVLNPEPRQAGSGPLLIVMDASWAEAGDWPRRTERAAQILAEAGRQGRPLAFLRLSDSAAPISFQSAEDWQGRLSAFDPNPWGPQTIAEHIQTLPKEAFDTIWFSDGIAWPGRQDLAAALTEKGELRIIEGSLPVLALQPASFEDGKIHLTLDRLLPEGPKASQGVAADIRSAAASYEIKAAGPDPAGIERELARISLEFGTGQARTTAVMELPPELRNRVTRFEILGQRSASGVSLTDDSLKRRKVALVSAGPQAESLQLLSPLHYLRQALQPVADLMEGPLATMLTASPDVVILPDLASPQGAEGAALAEWVEGGGLLLRFAGPRLAARDHTLAEDDPLLPVRLREGGRNVGGAMSWGEPKGLAPFDESSPFFGLEIPTDVEIRAQVLAQPDPDLQARTIAALDDGTPLVTRKTYGEGQIILVHVTANAEWSNLPLSGLFVQMLERLAISARVSRSDGADLKGQAWTPEILLDAYGSPRDAGEVAAVAGEALAQALVQGPGPLQRPGLYAGAERRVALNVVPLGAELKPALWPSNIIREGLALSAERSLKGIFLLAAFVALLLDVFAATALAGRLGVGTRIRGGAAILALSLTFFGGMPMDLKAQALPDDLPAPDLSSDPQLDQFALEATTSVVLAYVRTGDGAQDELSERGLAGLSDRLTERTSIEPAAPVGVNVERDELAFFPFLYWPVMADAPELSDAARGRLNQFLASGGMILFDTRDSDLNPSSGGSPEGLALQRITAGLDIPALEPIPEDHVLTRSFYLLQVFPGRQSASSLWVEAAPPEAKAEDGMPFRNLNDGVSPVVIGGNDWAAAWATSEYGVPLLPVGRGAGGDRQREISYRFGINLIMYVLTGNYKSDQVHVPALLERLGE